MMLGSVVPPQEGSVRRHSTTGRTPAKVRHIKAAKPSTTLADLLTLLFRADPGSAARTPPRA